MKKTILLFTILFTFNLVQSQSKTQVYNYGAVYTSTIIAKLSGSIKIDDSIVSLSTIDKNNVEQTNTYKFIKTANRVTYFTDGVTTYSLIINSESGKKKGFEYDTLIVWKFSDALTMMYYCKKED
jgi:hypothetical protein